MKTFITFEGIEGCGKTTQIRMAGDYLRKRQIPVLVTEEPGGAPLGKHIRKLLLNQGDCRIDAKAELLLFAAARAQHVQEVILPALAAGRVVLCDRFSDATLAYQGFGRGLSLEFIKSLNEFSAAPLKPDLTLLFDLPVEVGLGRAIDRIAHIQGAPREDRFEQEDRAFHQKIRIGYLSLARNEPGRIRMIDASRDVQTIGQEVCAMIWT
ncbi:MAG: dTMP kinase, partial [Deltaproteobacteria bacterium]|nr:dTMP kinase [Deltaproteobacteria bacterium]